MDAQLMKAALRQQLEYTTMREQPAAVMVVLVEDSPERLVFVKVNREGEPHGR